MVVRMACPFCCGYWSSLNVKDLFNLQVLCPNGNLCYAGFFLWILDQRGFTLPTQFALKQLGREVMRKRNLLSHSFWQLLHAFFIGYAPVVVFYTVVAAADDKQIDFKLFFVLYPMVDCFFASSLCFKPIAFRTTDKLSKRFELKMRCKYKNYSFFSRVLAHCENSNTTFIVCVSQVNLTPKLIF